MTDYTIIPDRVDVWVTSDLHFFHKNILVYEAGARGHFKDIPHMNEELINSWNSVVKPGDFVIFCGDMFMGQKSQWATIPPRLNSWENVYGVNGNHDGPKAAALFPNGLPEERYVSHKGLIYHLNHYPTSGDYQDRDYTRPIPQEVYHYQLNGHLHSKGGFSKDGKSLNVCWDLHRRLLHINEVATLCRTFLTNDKGSLFNG